MNQTAQPESIVNVWNYNLREQMAIISELATNYPIISIDTEFPGVIAYPSCSLKDFNYSLLKINVDRLKIIQLGLSLSDPQGHHPSGHFGWQFNFYFDLESDCYSMDSMHLLKNAGIDFEGHKKKGIDPEDFGSILTSSGLILENSYTWVCFHGFFDFGYLYKLVSGDLLPKDESSFLEKLFVYFPNVLDIKYMAQLLGDTKCGLNKLAEDFGIERIGIDHQAGSDSYVTGKVFYYMQNLLSQGSPTKMNSSFNIIYGLGISVYTCEKYYPNKENFESRIFNYGEFKTKFDISKHIEMELNMLNSRKKYDRNISASRIQVS